MGGWSGKVTSRVQRRGGVERMRPRYRPRARALVITAAVVGVATLTVACGGGTSSSTQGPASPASVGAPQPGSAWDGVLSQVQPDGTVSLATALAAFVLSVGPLPGVATPPG